ncbi:MAG: response regulator [Gammaproteobacteria bacterium]|nr:response regulator [Gammaproteobacteria bacterium]
MEIKSVLVVDDSKMARMVLQKQLESKDILVHKAASGEESIQFLENNQNDLPDLIFMDCLMPGVDGFQASTRILQNPKFANIPIIMCTGKESDEDRQKAFTLGAAGYMNKSSSSEPLNAILDEFSRQETEMLTTNTNTIDLDEVYKQVELTCTEIASKVSADKIAAYSEECSRNSNNQITSLTDQLEQKVIITAKHSLEETYAFVDEKVSYIENKLLADTKSELNNDLSSAVNELRDELKSEIEAEKSQVESMVQEMVQEQLAENSRKIQSLQDIVAENSAKNSNTLGVFAIVFSIIALAAALYPTLKGML